MPATAQQTFTSLINTSTALTDQFIKSLDSAVEPIETTTLPQSNASPLLLLTTASNSLKSTVTKLSLLIITTPFTHSAVSSLLKSLNESILPSLVTATLLTTSAVYPDAFSGECRSLTKVTLQEYSLLVKLLEKRQRNSTSKPDIGTEDKQEVTESTGRVWELCDALIRFADGGVVDFVVRKANQWLALMKDAVQELQEWDPEEEVDPDDIFGDVTSDDENDQTDQEQKPEDVDRATISAGVKDQALRVLSRIPQSIHVVIKQRLEKFPPRQTEESIPTRDQRQILNRILKRSREISECIDESAEGMYMGNLELCLKKAGEARALTIEVVESVRQPWIGKDAQVEETKEDKYIQRALLWIQQVGSEDKEKSSSRS